MDDDGAGWRLFAGIMILIVGAFNVIDGLRAITNASQIENQFPNGNVQLPLTDNIKTWGWVVLIMGVVMIASFFIVIANLVVDIVYAIVDPRVRL